MLTNLLCRFCCNSYLCAGGWIHGVSFSKDGSRLAWVSHDSCVTVADAANDSRCVIEPVSLLITGTRYMTDYV